MDSLYQKYHGKPGIGVHGLPGGKGNTGNGIFIGFINEFFDSTDISVNTLVKIAKRNINAQELATDYTEFANARLEEYTEATLNTDASYYPSAEDMFLQEANALYYSGRTETFTTESNKKKIYDIMDNKVESNTFYPDNALAHETPTTDRYVFNQIYNIVLGDKAYVQLYDYKKDEDGKFTNEPKYDVLIDVNHITYEPQDVVKIFGGYAEYNAPLYGSNDIDANAVLSFFNFISSNSVSGTKNHKWWKEVSYDNSDSKSAFERLSFDVNRDSAYTTDTDMLPEEYLDEESLYFNASTYAMGVDSHFGVNTKTNNVEIFDYEFTPPLPNISNMAQAKAPNKAYLKYDGENIADFFLTSYIHVTANTLPPVVLTEAFVDDYGYTQIGLDMYDPDINRALVLNNNKYSFNEELLYNILEEKHQETLKEFSKNYRNIAKQFLEKYEVTINHYKNNGATLADSSVRWGTTDYEKISIPTKLSDKFQVGDILYFYVDELQFAIDGQIHYMITLTEDLLNCDINTLIKKANAVDPFEYLTVFKNNDRIQLFDNVNILKNNVAYTDEENYYMKSFGNIISENTTDIMLIGTKENSDNSYNYLQLISYNKTIDNSTYLSIDSSIIDGRMNHYISSDEQIKLDNLYIKNDILLTNLESLDVIYDDNLLYSDDNCLLPLTSNDVIVKVNMGDIYGNNTVAVFNTYIFKFDKSKFITDIQKYDDYQVGYIVYVDSDIIQEKLYSNTDNNFFIELDPITDTDILNKNIDEYPYTENITYNILVYIHKTNGFNIYTHTTSIKCILDCVEKYKIVQPEYELTVDNDINDIKGSDMDNIIFKISGITVNKADNIIFDISTNNEDVFIDSVFFNNKELVVNKSFWSWADNVDDIDEVEKRLSTNITWMDVTPDTDSILHNKGHKIFTLSVNDNIPDIMYNNSNTRVITENIHDFMHTFNDEDVRTSDEFNYGNLFNNEGDDIQCMLFDRIMDELPVSMAAPRVLNVAVKYHIQKDGEESNHYTEYYENYELKQPGFSDPRTIPNVNLNIHTDINELESFNTIESGILCNQFQTFMDINITDFDYDTWGKYIVNDTDTTLDVDITNVPNDLDWQLSLSISLSYTRATLKLLPDDQVILTDDTISNVKYNNCVKFNINVFKNSTNKALNKLTQNDINVLTAEFQNKCDIILTPMLMESAYGRVIADEEMVNGYILLSNDICRGLKNPSLIYSGIFENIKIHLHDLTVEDVKDTIYTLITLEYGNPILSNLYLQFAVTHLTVHYKGEDNTIYSFSTYADKNNIVDTYLHLIEDYKETYKYISNKLDLNINPISLIACPPEIELNLLYLSGSVKKTGSEDQIKLSMKFFGNDLYTDDSIIDINNGIKRNSLRIDLNGIQIKYKHLQDNVKYISFSTLDIIDSINKVADNYVFKYADYESILTKKKLYEPITNKNYLSVIYHSTLLNPKLRDDKRTFYYNEKLYLESKYDLFNRNCPIFISEEHDWEIRNDDIMTAIDTWNFEYQSQKKLEKNSKVFAGILNNFGNGYMYLPDEVDTNLYLKNNVLPLQLVKEYNEQTLWDKIEYFDINTPTPININTPAEGKYFRVPLYHMSWEYPVYNGKNITPYYIVSLFDYLLINSNKDGIITARTLNDYNMSYLINLKNVIPYNVLFNISPKILYNDDTNTINMLMLRRPSIEDDTDLSESCVNSCYKLNTRYFNTVDEIRTYLPETYNLP